MGLFKKKQKEVKKELVAVQTAQPSVPKLPRLPELPGMGVNEKGPSLKPTYKLPSYPPTALGEKFSRDTIKEAVTGEKEDLMGFDENEFPSDEFGGRRIQKPVKKPFRKEIARHGAKEAEPVFIRLDKFKESLDLFEKTKRQISEIESMLTDIKNIKEDEDRELAHWEKEVQTVKEQIERIDNDVFSRIE